MTTEGTSAATLGMTNPEHVPFLDRAFAFIIDCFLVTGLHTGCFFIVFSIIPGNTTAPGQLAASMLLLFSCFSLFPLAAVAYFTLMHANGGQTLGKLLFDIRVTNHEGHEISAGTAFLRWTGYFLSAFPLGLGFFMALLNDRSRTWHDALAGTIVCRASEKQLDIV